jgi:hypothetical protein
MNSSALSDMNEKNVLLAQMESADEELFEKNLQRT